MREAIYILILCLEIGITYIKQIRTLIFPYHVSQIVKDRSEITRHVELLLSYAIHRCQPHTLLQPLDDSER